MKHLALLPALLLAAPAPAQEADPPGPSGLDLIGEGAGQILQGLREDAQPALDGLAGLGAEAVPTLRVLVAEWGPGFLDVFRQVDSVANYEAPAIQPDGDILIRRRPGAPEWTPPAP